jgi:5-(carboxyamino)imidazole ribonucleotide mutase
MKVIIIMGSPSDKDWAEKIESELKKWNLEFETHIASAHKVPEKVFELVQKYNQEKDLVYVTIAGRSNGLSGVVAANSIHPVIACPPFKDKKDMIINLNSTLQMPSDTPVLTVLDPKNVAAACARILGLADVATQNKIKERIIKIKKGFEM